MKIPTKSSLGSPPLNSNMLRILFPTFIPLTPTNPDLYLFYNLTPPFPNFSSTFLKNHPTFLRSLIPHLYSDITPTFPLSFQLPFLSKKKNKQTSNKMIFIYTNKNFYIQLIFLQKTPNLTPSRLRQSPPLRPHPHPPCPLRLFAPLPHRPLHPPRATSGPSS